MRPGTDATTCGTSDHDDPRDVSRALVEVQQLEFSINDGVFPRPGGSVDEECRVLRGPATIEEHEKIYLCMYLKLLLLYDTELFIFEEFG